MLQWFVVHTFPTLLILDLMYLHRITGLFWCTRAFAFSFTGGNVINIRTLILASYVTLLLIGGLYLICNSIF